MMKKKRSLIYEVHCLKQKKLLQTDKPYLNPKFLFSCFTQTSNYFLSHELFCISKLYTLSRGPTPFPENSILRSPQKQTLANSFRERGKMVFNKQSSLIIKQLFNNNNNKEFQLHHAIVLQAGPLPLYKYPCLNGWLVHGDCPHSWKPSPRLRGCVKAEIPLCAECALLASDPRVQTGNQAPCYLLPLLSALSERIFKIAFRISKICFLFNRLHTGSF